MSLPIVLVLVGCGEGPAQIVPFSVPMPARLGVELATCPAVMDAGGDFLSNITAELRISSFEPCPLEVDNTTGAVSGNCEEIRKGSVRFPILTWGLRPPTGSTAAEIKIGYHATVVDLKDIGDEVASVELPLLDDGELDRLLWHHDQMVGIPDNKEDLTETEGIEEAIYFAQDSAMTYDDPGPPANPYLDVDGDGCPNVSEACIGGATLLYSATDNSTDCDDYNIRTDI